MNPTVSNFLITTVIFLIIFPITALGNSGDVVFNEIAWMGTIANSADEWLEFYNTTNRDIDLSGWRIYEKGGQAVLVPLSGIIKSYSYYLIERSDEKTISDIVADQKPISWGGNGLSNNGEHLQLRDNSNQLVDELDCSAKWFAGKASPSYQTMERKSPFAATSDPTNWASNNGSAIVGHDLNNNLINGTPQSKNSVANFTQGPATDNQANPLKDSQPIDPIQNDPVTAKQIEPINPQPITEENYQSPIVTKSPDPQIIVAPPPVEKSPALSELVTPTEPIINNPPPIATPEQNSPRIETNRPNNPPLAAVIQSIVRPPEETAVRLNQQESAINSPKTVSPATPEKKLTKNLPPKSREVLILISVIILAFLGGLGLIYYRKM